MNPYESDKLLSEYLLFHYGTEVDILGAKPGPREALDFAVRCVTELLGPAMISADATALDIGCAVGRSSFELARHVASVTGIDFSHRFIEAATALQQTGKLETFKIEEGEITTPFIARVPSGLDRSRVRFAQGDAMALPADQPPCDILLAANLICRLPDPQKFLARLPSLIKPGGQLLLTTPFTWLADFTPPEHWLGGRGQKKSFVTLREILKSDFELQHTQDMPFLIREHARKYQYGIALGSRWIRN